MKRCPQCEFIYEDDQSLCDMDGVLLVFDSRTLPNFRALAPVEAQFPIARPYWRHRTFPAMAALILATVVSLGYFLSAQRAVNSSAPLSGPAITIPVVNPVTPSQTQPPPATEANATAATETPKEADAKPETTNKAVSTTAPTPAKKAAAKSPAATQSKPAEEPKKDDSKVGSILKKTGRILKKPFKL